MVSARWPIVEKRGSESNAFVSAIREAGVAGLIAI